MTIYLQRVLGLSPLEAGLSFAPMAVAAIAGMGVAAQMVARVGPRWVLATGALIAAVGLMLLSRLEVESSYVTRVLPGLLLVGFGGPWTFIASQAPSCTTWRQTSPGSRPGCCSAGRRRAGPRGARDDRGRTRGPTCRTRR
jgi:Na+/melibiose symporter-like transporter